MIDIYNTWNDLMNEKIDEWHESNSDQSLSDYLGMTDDEYAAWVEDPKAFFDRI